VRIVFAGGGTGGHLYPAIAIAHALKKQSSEIETFFIGARRGIEKDVLPGVGFPFELLELHPLYRSKIWENWRTIFGAVSAWRTISRHFREERPVCVVGTGGYASGLALAYAAVHGIPIVLQEQNSHPGITARFFSKYAKQIHVGFPEARAMLNAKTKAAVCDTGNPIEPPPDPLPDKIEAHARWSFPDDVKVLLVYGGSQGAKAINDVVAAWIDRGLPEGLRIIWGTGKKSYDDYAKYDSGVVRVRAYLSPITEAYAAADFAISRGGAMATAELCAWGIPPIVIPLPTAAADHQTSNARALAQAGAAEWIPQSQFSVDKLDSSVRNLLLNPAELESRKKATLSRARPDAANSIARSILEMLKPAK
jgi:UDP-N-acetylglucosamine--N-acetylmuramyl-(pentapeptide) pyrophosphoryl-undecaprenol N-acetylglucosamine transferase